MVDIYASQQNVGDGGSVAMSMVNLSVQLPTILFHSPAAADHGYYFFGEWASLIDNLRQKIKKASSLPLVEQREEYVIPNFLHFPAIDWKDFFWDSPNDRIGQSWEPIFAD